MVAPRFRIFGIVIAAIFCSQSAIATPLTVGGGWAILEWNCGEGQIVSTAGCDATPADGFYEFTLTQAGTLTLTDLFTAGDEFDVTVSRLGDGVSTVSSSPVAAADEGFQPCPDFGVEPCYSTFGAGAFVLNAEAAGDYYLTSGHYSTLRLGLVPGTYEVAFALTALAPDVGNTFPGDFQDAGLAVVRVDAVPEPATLVLMGSGLGMVVASHRRRRAGIQRKKAGRTWPSI